MQITSTQQLIVISIASEGEGLMSGGYGALCRQVHCEQLVRAWGTFGSHLKQAYERGDRLSVSVWREYMQVHGLSWQHSAVAANSITQAALIEDRVHLPPMLSQAHAYGL